MENNVVSSKKKSDYYNPSTYTFGIFSSMLLWLLPIGFVAGFINGFTQLHITIIISGMVHFLISIYMLWKNTPFNNFIQILLNIAHSLFAIYFSRPNSINGVMPNLYYVFSTVEFLTIAAIIVTTIFTIFNKQNKTT